MTMRAHVPQSDPSCPSTGTMSRLKKSAILCRICCTMHFRSSSFCSTSLQHSRNLALAHALSLSLFATSAQSAACPTVLGAFGCHSTTSHCLGPPCAVTHFASSHVHPTACFCFLFQHILCPPLFFDRESLPHYLATAALACFSFFIELRAAYVFTVSPCFFPVPCLRHLRDHAALCIVWSVLFRHWSQIDHLRSSDARASDTS